MVPVGLAHIFANGRFNEPPLMSLLESAISYLLGVGLVEASVFLFSSTSFFVSTFCSAIIMVILVFMHEGVVILQGILYFVDCHGLHAHSILSGYHNIFEVGMPLRPLLGLLLFLNF